MIHSHPFSLHSGLLLGRPTVSCLLSASLVMEPPYRLLQACYPQFSQRLLVASILIYMLSLIQGFEPNWRKSSVRDVAKETFKLLTRDDKMPTKANVKLSTLDRKPMTGKRSHSNVRNLRSVRNPRFRIKPMTTKARWSFDDSRRIRRWLKLSQLIVKFDKSIRWSRKDWFSLTPLTWLEAKKTSFYWKKEKNSTSAFL